MNHLEGMLSTKHKDIEYLSQYDISLTLSKCLTETFKAKPLEPKKYFAKLLLNCAAQKRQERVVSHSLTVTFRGKHPWSYDPLTFDLLFEYRGKRSLSRSPTKKPATTLAARFRSARRLRSRRLSTMRRSTKSRSSVTLRSLKTWLTTCLDSWSSCRSTRAPLVSM